MEHRHLGKVADPAGDLSVIDLKFRFFPQMIVAPNADTGTVAVVYQESDGKSSDR
jgi:hypothetical protein